MLWFHDSLTGVTSENNGSIAKLTMLELAEGYLARFEDELEQIRLKNSIGGSKHNKKSHYASRMDAIKLTVKTETDEFEGCGLEMPNLLDKETLTYFRDWNGELRFIQNINLKRFRKSDLVNDAGCVDETKDDVMDE